MRLERDVSDADRYGRLLRYVYVEDRLINEELVREGYAQAASFPPDVKYQERLLAAERAARTEGAGREAEATPFLSLSPFPALPTGTDRCCYPCPGADRDCADVRTQAKAQVFFRCYSFSAAHDPMQLDGRGVDDGHACEALP